MRGIPRGEDAPPATSTPLHGAPFPCDFVRVLPLAVGLRGEIDDPQQVLERLDTPKAPCRSPWPRPTSGWGAASAGPGEDCLHPAMSSASIERIGNLLLMRNCELSHLSLLFCWACACVFLLLVFMYIKEQIARDYYHWRRITAARALCVLITFSDFKDFFNVVHY